MCQKFGISCLMSSNCKYHRTTMTFILGTVLGLTLGCTLTLTYIISLAPSNNHILSKTDFNRLPRMTLDATRYRATPDTDITSNPKVDHSDTAVSTTTTTVGTTSTVKNNNDTMINSPSSKLPHSPSSLHNSKTEDLLVTAVNNMKTIESLSPLQSKYRKPYLAVVMAAYTPPSKLEAIYDTWGRDVPGIRFFTHGSKQNQQLYSEGMPIIQLNELLIATSKWKHLLSIVNYVYSHYYNDYNWFIITPDSVYLNGQGFHELTSRISPEFDVYLGHPVVSNTDEEESPRITYCKSQLGIVISRSLLNKLATNLKYCQGENDVKWDIRLGQCISKLVHQHCGDQLEEMTKYFTYDVNSYTEYLWEDTTFLRSLTLGPVTADEHMYTLHYFYKLKQYNSIQNKMGDLSEQIKQVCQNLPQSALDNEKATDVCTSLKSSNVQESEEQLDEREDDSITIPISKFHPHNRFQVQPWNYFDAINIYEDESVMPRRSLKTYKYLSMELQKALQEAVKTASRRHHARLRFKKIVNGYVRHNALIGNEYIIDAKFVEARNPRKHIEKRIRLLRPLASNYIVQPSKTNSTETIHFVVPITKVTQRFEDFLKMYEKLALIPREKVHLILVVYGEEDVRQISQNVSIYLKKFPKSEMTIIQGYGEFSRAKALDLGMSKLQDNDLAFFCDVDMNVGRQFLTKCRRNTIQGSSVYYPEVFKLYNRKYVYRNGWHSKKYSINREQGHWGYYAYGMLCMYKSDYKATGGLDVAMLGWGGEDVDLYERVLKSGLEVLRSPDSSLIHRWHSKSCKMQSSPKMLEHCLMSQAEVLADRRELARYIFDIQGLEEESNNT